MSPTVLKPLETHELTLAGNQRDKRIVFGWGRPFRVLDGVSILGDQSGAEKRPQVHSKLDRALKFLQRDVGLGHPEMLTFNWIYDDVMKLQGFARVPI